MRFDGDIVIADPVYIATLSDWDKCSCGNNLPVIGFENFLADSTLCGDWECYIIDDKNKQIGHITADSGQVGVFMMDEVKKYDRKIYEFIKQNKHDVCIICNFHGDIQFYESIQDDIEYTKIKGVGNINFQNVLDI
jgi:hypothetical protein